MIEAATIRDRARGRWREILIYFGFIPESLTGRNGPCCKCGGKDRFRFIDEDCGAVLCNQCFKEKNGDGIAAIQWLKGWTFVETVKELAIYLRLVDEPQKPIEIVSEIARRKRMPVESFRAFGAVAASRDGMLVARVPMFDGDMQKISYFDHGIDNEKLLKGMCAFGQPAGLFVAEAPHPGDKVLLIEGVKDSSAAYGVGYKAVGVSGSDLRVPFVKLFAGCDVTVVPDRDVSGEKGARVSAGRLYGVARSVRIATLPGECKLKDGDGIREVLAMRGGEQLLKDAITNAVEWHPSGEKRRPTVVTLMSQVQKVADLAKGGGIRTMSIGVPIVDKAIKGIADGELIVIGGRPSHGKSMLAMQWLDVAASNGVPSLIVSEEMSALALGSRGLTYLTDVPDEQWGVEHERVQFDINQHFENRKDVLIAESCATVEMAVSMIDEAISEHGIKLVAVDYAQLLRGGGSNRYEQVSDVSSQIKRCAVRNNVPVLMLCQLNREKDKQGFRAPRLADLKDSSQLEQDADVVLFVEWPWKDSPEYEDTTEYRVYCAKNRNRGIREPILKLRIRPERQRVEEPALPHNDDAERWN